VNGHIRHQFGARSQAAIAEARHRLAPQDALLRQTLEMDADSEAVVACMREVIFAEWDPDEPARIGCHPVYRKPEMALRLWLFAVYGVFRIMEHDSRPTPAEESSHPSPMMRMQMIFGTLLEGLKQYKLDRLLNLLPSLVEQTISDSEKAYAAVTGKSPDIEPLKLSLSESAQKHIGAIIAEWRRVRPIIEPFARDGSKLAPLPEDT